MTDRERAEAALVKAGFERKGRSLTIDPFTYFERWSDCHCDCAHLFEDGTYHLDLRGDMPNMPDLPSLLSPTLTDEERKALEWAIGQCHPDPRFASNQYLPILRGLLKRLGGAAQ